MSLKIRTGPQCEEYTAAQGRPAPAECVRLRVRWKASRRRHGVRAIEERFGSYVDEHPAVFRFEKWLQIYAGKHPTAFYGLYRLARKDQARVVTPDTQLVIEGFPRSANTFARVAFNAAQSGRVRIAHGLHVPAQVVRAAQCVYPPWS